MNRDKVSKLIIDAFKDFVDELDKIPKDFKERDLQSRFYTMLLQNSSDASFWKRIRVEYNPFDKSQRKKAHEYARDKKNRYKYLKHLKEWDKNRKSGKKLPESIIKDGTFDISIYKNGDSTFKKLTHAIEIKRLIACSGHQGVEDIYVLTDILDTFYNGAKGYSLTIVWPPKNSKKSDEYIVDIRKAFENTKRENQIYYYGIVAPKKGQRISRDLIIEGGKALL